MQHVQTSCQLPCPTVGDSPVKSPVSDRLRVDAAHQWVSTTAGRIATDPYSWMQAVHWVGGSGLYQPSRQHGPKWGPTTVVIAQLLSVLTECRPGVDWIARKLNMSERTVQYHLDMLREAGLLAYRYKGTRISGRIKRASEFERVIPPAFDVALGIRTKLRDDTAPAHTRVPVGIAEEGRTLIAKLAKKAARKVRRRRSKTAVARGSRCTPMQVGTSTVSTTGSTRLPSDNNVASGEADCPTPKSSKRGPRTLNKTGRRKQLAGELITQVPWLGRASRDRISWVTRHVADAGWSVLEVQAIAEMGGPIAAGDVRRCSGMLAHRLKGVHLLYPTAAQRQRLVADWQESRPAEHARHDGYDQGPVGGPERMSVRRIVAQAMDRMRELTAQALETADTEPAEIAVTDEVRLEDLDRDTIIDLRVAAMKDPGAIHQCIEYFGEDYARRLYTNQLVNQALSTSSRIRVHTWQEATHA